MFMSLKEFKKWFLPQVLISYTFLVSGLIINVLQLITFITIRPFNKHLYKRIIYYLSYSLYSAFPCLTHWWSRTKVTYYAKDEDFKMFGKENCFCVLNHKYDVDWNFGLVICQQINLLGGSKVVLKDSLKYIPILGWSWAFGEYIFLKRVWDKDHKILVEDMKNILDYPKDLPYSISIFCEGTRYTKEKYEESAKIAKEKGVPVLKHHLLPRSKGFNLMASQIKGKIDYLYDITLAIDDVEGHSPTFLDIKDGIPLDVQIFIRRIPMSLVPAEDEKKCSDFLQKLYMEKDEIFDVYHRTGSFDELGVNKHVIKLNKWDLYNSIFWLAVILIPSFYYFVSLLLNGSWLIRGVIFFIFVTVNFLTKKMMAESSSKNGSSFGLPKKLN
ncbi:unnamed protein product [Brachionus calyciflorus]|uniref:Phospholipid/glycerol acyltransferase domain-containing protein n=1 Tax=Brachionus calyciflorus TaxID=104777 RepID=A0A813NV44_9BILA|nr:unnamed protein product [Brachionus calyciflorus]